MSKRRSIDFSLRLYNARGRRIALAKLRYAHSYEVYYGKRKVLPRKLFTRFTKKVSERRQLLGLLIVTLRTRHVAHLAKLRRQREKKKIEERNKRIARNRKRRVKRKKIDDSEEIGQRYLRSEGVKKAKLSILEFDKAEAVEPVTAVRATVVDTMKIPVKPTGTDFVKTVYDKTMSRFDLREYYHIALIDYSLKENSYIPMSEENFDSAYREALFKMLPHVLDYFSNTMKSGDQYIFRIKFKHHWENSEKYYDMGISGRRIQLRSLDEMFAVFRETFELLFGGKGLDMMTSKNKERANYLQSGYIYITGFTLESANVQSI